MLASELQSFCLDYWPVAEFFVSGSLELRACTALFVFRCCFLSVCDILYSLSDYV